MGRVVKMSNFIRPGTTWAVWRREGLSYHEWRIGITDWMLQQFANGRSQQEIANVLAERWPGIPIEFRFDFCFWYVHRFIADWTYHFRRYLGHEKTYLSKRGRPKKLLIMDIITLKEVIALHPNDLQYELTGEKDKKNPPAWTARLLKDVMRRWGVKLSEKTLRRILHLMGYRWDEEEGYVLGKKTKSTHRSHHFQTPPAPSPLERFINDFVDNERLCLIEKINAMPSDPSLVS
jgi:transposase